MSTLKNLWFAIIAMLVANVVVAQDFKQGSEMALLTVENRNVLVSIKGIIEIDAILYGANKSRSNASIIKTGKKGTITGCGYGGHFRAVQSFKYLGK